jgi:hypothetical protein
MKKISLSFFTMVVAINFSYAQWTGGPTGPVYYNGGSVGIGTMTPATILHLYKASADNEIKIEATGLNKSIIGLANAGTDYAQLYFDNNTNNVVLFQKYARGDLLLGTNSTTNVTIKSGGGVGIGATNLISTTVKLQLSGAALISNIGGNEIVINSAGINYGFFENPSAGVWSLGYGTAPAVLGTPVLSWNTGGNVGIGTTSPDAKLAVNGIIHTQEVKVDLTGWPDYVFKANYNLPSLSEVKTYIDQNHHLPEMPSAEQVAKDGLSLGDMNAKLLKKVEELTLYLIDKDKQIKDLQCQVDELKRDLAVNQGTKKELEILKKK